MACQKPAGRRICGPKIVRAIQLTASDTQSGAEMTMRLSNRADFAGARWQPFEPSLNWDFNNGSIVYVQFRDGAGNISRVYAVSLTGVPDTGTSPTPA